ncbi:SNF2 family N-terminal domain-containing protein [Annulohypoxylon truncatum]|uniref:SNF2 family N-terminal domain-containing protein n=1 Tax=Annulohypoxylon truncatum TaxID=327061 RepID=UPI002007B3D7|nr:SNF2 family N-terminal domain-containing protein [Annulohypoxylon truncatum]KAI1208369.1 SNF2 family N-terminal domain-containing protein [Annulohypoxylon truncatum]
MDRDHESDYPSKRPRLNSPPISRAVSTPEEFNFEFEQHLTAKAEPYPNFISFVLQDAKRNEKWLCCDSNAQVDVSCSPASKQSETVCFGMISHISGTCELLGIFDILPEFPVQLDSSDRFSIKGDEKMDGRIQSIHGQMIQGLLDEQTLDLHVNCVLNTQPARSKSFRKLNLLQCTLEITIYGPMDLYDEIGSWFQDYEIYLQDPRTCHLDVKYYNPQRLSSDNLESCPLVSEVINMTSSLIPLQHVAEQTDMLDVLSNRADLEETPQPEAIRTTLKRHQKQALTFILGREKGSVNAKGCKDIWETVINDQGRVFVNTIANTCQTEEPPQFNGGIIADPMGLGKTLVMIALTTTDVDPRYGLRALDTEEEIERFSTPATLIIIPPPLIGSWEEQLTGHVFGDRLKFCRHHGKTRLRSLAELQNMNVVLTTFHTVSAEWKGNARADDSILFAVRWRRIILDEAHFIRNGNSRMSQAVCALESDSRWAVTGTPIQNRLTDLATLLKFIRAHPYDDPRRFEADISNLWKVGEEEEAVRRLKRLSTFLLFRRPKGTINLPPRRDLLLPIDFNQEERQVYDGMRNQVITRIDEALHDATRAPRTGSYCNALQQIESLRLFSNLGLHYHSRNQKDGSLLSVPEEWPKVAQRTFDSQREITPFVCMQCSSAVELAEEWLNGSNVIRQSGQFFECLKYVCGDCVDKIHRRKRPVSCGHVPSCAVAPVSTNSTTLEETPDLVAAEMGSPSAGLSSKIKALVTDLKSGSVGVKCVVFSTWRLTLDIVQAGLNDAGIRSIRFDGKVPQKDRQSAIDSFRTDPSIRVMLLTLSCGAVGLTLTVASRAYLMEPHWNPTLEEQALARVHRLGQTEEVTTVRLYIRDSFEEQVMQVQESKKQLAGVLLSPHDGKNTDNSLAGLEKLRALL